MTDRIEQPADTLLFPLFEELLRRNIPLGVSEYVAAVQCLRSGVGLESPDHLKETLSLIWAKSYQDRQLLDDLFQQIVEPALRPECRSGDTDRSHDEFESDAGTDPSVSEITFDQTVIRSGKGKASEQPCGPAKPMRLPGPENLIYQLTPRYPVSRREMTRAFRHLRRMERVGPPEELDVSETIDRIGKTGVFMGPALRPLRRNQAALLLLIDSKGSMEPFAPLVRNLTESVTQNAKLGSVKIFYFHDCPEQWVFEDEKLTLPVPADDVLTDRISDHAVLFISDAGAARGDYDSDRIEAAKALDEKLGAAVHRCVWLNPVPKSRWSQTSAQAVGKIFPMFPINREGLMDAVNRLRGCPSGAPYDPSD